MKILILEKDFNTCWILSKILKDFKTITASTLEEAKLIIETESIDIIIGAARLVDGSIVEIIKNYPSIPTIVISANPAIDRVDLLISAGAKDYIKKPIQKHEVWKTLEKFLDKVTETRDLFIMTEQATINAYKKVKNYIIEKVPFLIVGEPGVGKRSLIRQIGNKLGLHVLEGKTLKDSPTNVIVIDLEKVPFKDQEEMAKKIKHEVISAAIVFLLHNDEKEVFSRDLLEESLKELIINRIVRVPPIRERKSEIIPIFELYLEKLTKNRIEIDEEAKAILTEYQWPGNISEIIEIAKEVSRVATTRISTEHLPIDLKFAEFSELAKHVREAVRKSLESGSKEIYNKIMKLTESIVIHEALKASRFKQTQASRLLGIHRNTIRYKIKELNIPTEDEDED